MDIENILSRFQDVTETHEGYVARCSAHMDSNPSLCIWVTEGTGKVRLHCRAGCETKDVIAAVGLRWQDLGSSTGTAKRAPKDEPKPVGPQHTAPLMMYVSQCEDALLGPYTTAHRTLTEDYITRRFGLDRYDIERLMLGVSYGEGFKHTHGAFESYPRLVVPFLSFDGTVHGMQGRDVSGRAEKKHRWVGPTNPDGYAWGKYGIMDRPESDTVIISEGPGDGLTAYAAGYSALIIRGAAMVRNEALRAEIAQGLSNLGKRVIAAGDNDSAGRKFTAACAEHFRADLLSVLGKGNDLTAWREDSPSLFKRRLDRAVARATPAGMSKAQATRMRALLAAYTEEG